MKTATRKNIKLNIQKQKTATAKEVLQIIENSSERIESINFIPPKLGKKSLGKFLVTYEW